MPADELVDLLLALRMKVLKFMHRLEFNNIKPVRQDAVRLALEEVLALICSDMRHSCEDVCAMRGGALNAVAMVDSALASLVVDIEILQVVVEIDTSCA